MGRLTPSFRQVYSEVMDELRKEIRDALIDPENKDAFNLLYKQAWYPEEAAMGNSSLPTVLDKLCVLGFIGRAARYIPIQAVTGFLLVLGALIIFPSNAPEAMNADPIVGGVTAVVTGATMDPFIGMIAGLLVKGLMMLFPAPVVT